MTFRFRVTYEDHEDVYRDIEIKTSQSFADLHAAIQQAIGFDNSKPAYFYDTDDYWRKGSVLAAVNTGEKPGAKRDKKGNGSSVPSKPGPLASFVNDPHQRFIYLFDPDREWTFLIELLKISEPTPGEIYPRCVKSAGTAPKQHKVVTPPPVEDEEDDKIDPIAEDSDAREPEATEIPEDLSDLEDDNPLSLDVSGAAQEGEEEFGEEDGGSDEPFEGLGEEEEDR